MKNGEFFLDPDELLCLLDYHFESLYDAEDPAEALNHTNDIVTCAMALADYLAEELVDDSEPLDSVNPPKESE